MTATYAFESKGIPWDALNQSKNWYDKQGNLYEITQMTPQHARGAFKKLAGAYGMAGTNSPLGQALWTRASQ